MDKQITTILNRVAEGQSEAMDELVPLVYDQMRRIAASALRDEAVQHNDPTELVHEAYLRLIGNENLAWSSRAHFFGACATVIRRILVDHARSRKRQKRGGGVIPLPLAENDVGNDAQVDLVELDEALQELAGLSPRQVRIVELKYFGGMSEIEIADLLQVSRRTVSGDWAMAKAWLKLRLA